MLETRWEDLRRRITMDPAVLAGKPVIRGMRISVEQILTAIAGGISQEELLEEYPGLEPEDIQAAIQYAAELVAAERVYPIP